MRSRIVRFVKKKYSSFLEQRITRLSAQERENIDQYISRLNTMEHQPNTPIKVGFVVQMPEIWNKEAPLYEAMVMDSRFDPWLIVVPIKRLDKRKRSEYGKELAYFKKEYPSAQMLTSKDLTESFCKLEKHSFHYVFFQRCWESYLPEALSTHQVIRYAKTCYIPYVYHFFDEWNSYYKMRFFSSLYVMFCSNDSQLKQYQPKDSRNSLYLGYPCLTDIQYLPLSKNKNKTILWTPRWDTSLDYGGTSFFGYRNNFVSLKKKYPSCQILLRPHPLTFERAIKHGEMTQDEVAAYKKNNEDAGIFFDTNASVDTTLPNVDILISDFSSILADALLAGKAIIYCGRETVVPPNASLLSLLKVVYHAKNWNEVEEYVDMLLNNVDPLEPERKKLAQKWKNEHANSCARILDYLNDDFYQLHSKKEEQ